MALKDWWDVPYTAADCVRDHNQWNSIVEYVKHSACTDFTIHSTCTSGGQAFRFTQVGATSYIYGGLNSGDNTTWFANDFDTYPYIKLYGAGNIRATMHTGAAFKLFDGATEALKIKYTVGETKIHGGVVATDDILFYANTGSGYAKFKLIGQGDCQFYHATGSNFDIFDAATKYIQTGYAANVSTMEGGAITGDNLVLKANSVNAGSNIILEGNGNVALNPAAGSFVKFGTFVGTGDVVCTGHIVMEDSAGNQRKLMICA